MSLSLSLSLSLSKPEPVPVAKFCVRLAVTRIYNLSESPGPKRSTLGFTDARINARHQLSVVSLLTLLSCFA